MPRHTQIGLIQAPIWLRLRLRGRQRAYDLCGDVMQQATVRPRVAVHCFERLVDCRAVPLREDAFGLLDHDSAVQRVLQLTRENLLCLQVAAEALHDGIAVSR